MCDTFVHVRLPPHHHHNSLYGVQLPFSDTALHPSDTSCLQTQLKCVRKLFYTNLSLTFSPNEAWPKVLQGRGRGVKCREFELIKHALLLLLFMRAWEREKDREMERATHH